MCYSAPLKFTIVRGVMDVLPWVPQGRASCSPTDKTWKPDDIASAIADVQEGSGLSSIPGVER
jgi:hypothetical protein